jgi:hypothetical protein
MESDRFSGGPPCARNRHVGLFVAALTEISLQRITIRRTIKIMANSMLIIANMGHDKKT